MTTDKIQKTEDQWREELAPDAFEVLRNAATERPFTGELLHNKETGMYQCAGCGADLFASDTKFDSGSGWPSFYEPAIAENIVIRVSNGVKKGSETISKVYVSVLFRLV